MRINIFTILLLVCLSYLPSLSQIERLRIETYYISDGNDATDTLGGGLEVGSTTYRIFVDLLPGSKLLAIYGDANHPLVFTSSAPFFNHREEGVSFGKDMSRNRFEIGTVPLDSYITLGQCSRSFAQGAYFGIPKELDLDGSVIGGVNNDGGSEGIATGLLTNADSQMGIPLVTADGLGIVKDLPNSWLDVGFIDIISNTDTTIFGSEYPKYSFNRNNTVLRNSGVTGVDQAQNEILVAQLTTKGEITFEINLEVEILIEGIPQTIKYVAQNEPLGANEIYVPLLKYPYTCGCKDPAYLEASTSFACEDNTQCKTLIVFGCSDSLACNYNPDANFSLDELCCYVGFCNDLDISIVCPDLRPRVTDYNTPVRLFPNPATTEIQLEIDNVVYNDIRFTIYDIYGRSVKKGTLTKPDRTIDVSVLPAGFFSVYLNLPEHAIAVPFVKL